MRTIEDFLKETVEIHDTLNPKIWSEDEELLPNVKKKLSLAAKTFEEQLKDSEIPLVVDDVRVMGSNANYNYNDGSDLDLHIIADLSDDCEEGHLKKLYDIYRSLFNSKYDIEIKGIPVEIFVEDKVSPSKYSNGVYSLEKGWIKKPKRVEVPEIDTNKIDSEVNTFIEDISKLVDEAQEKEPDEAIDSIDNLVDKLYEKRQSSMVEEGEFGFYNQVFKELRRKGYLQQLKDLRVKLVNKNLSI